MTYNDGAVLEHHFKLRLVLLALVVGDPRTVFLSHISKGLSNCLVLIAHVHSFGRECFNNMCLPLDDELLILMLSTFQDLHQLSIYSNDGLNCLEVNNDS